MDLWRLCHSCNTSKVTPENLVSLFKKVLSSLCRRIKTFCVGLCMVGLSAYKSCFSVQEEEQWLFLSRKTSLRKRSLKYLVDEAHCLWSDAIRHNITGQSDRIMFFYYEKKYLGFPTENF